MLKCEYAYTHAGLCPLEAIYSLRVPGQSVKLACPDHLLDATATILARADSVVVQLVNNKDKDA